MEGKQTAVEWLVSQVEDFHCLLPVDMIEQAKQMEKQQIMKAIERYYPYSGRKIAAEKYYNETYLNENDNGI